jgi:metal-sulfur cluster biosynthetic enzyme
MTTAEAVREACRGVVDPCTAATGSNLDVVEMGLLQSVDVTDGTVTVELRLTTPACHMVPYFVEAIEDAVGSLPDVEAVTVQADRGLTWTPDMMSDEAKARRRAVLDEYESRYADELPAE